MSEQPTPAPRASKIMSIFDRLCNSKKGHLVVLIVGIGLFGFFMAVVEIAKHIAQK